jgi:hypothetical protein
MLIDNPDVIYAILKGNLGESQLDHLQNIEDNVHPWRLKLLVVGM